MASGRGKVARKVGRRVRQCAYKGADGRDDGTCKSDIARVSWKGWVPDCAAAWSVGVGVAKLSWLGLVAISARSGRAPGFKICDSKVIW